MLKDTNAKSILITCGADGMFVARGVSHMWGAQEAKVARSFLKAGKKITKSLASADQDENEQV